MDLALESSNPSKTILRAKRTYGFFFVLLKILGYATLAVGVLLILGDPEGTSWQITLGFGMFFWGIAHAIRNMARYQPSRLEFDNHSATLTVFQNGEHRESVGVQIPYARLRRFSTTHRYDDGIQYFCTALEFKNGSLWVLSSPGDEKKATGLTHVLESAVPFGQGVSNGIPELPASVQVEKSAGTTSYTWNFDLLSRKNLPTYLAVIGFLWAMLAAVSTNDTFGRIAVLVFASVISGAFLYFAVRWVGARGCLEIDSSEVRYFERRGFTKRLRHSISRADLDRVLCGAGAAGGDKAIYFVKAGEFQELKKIEAGEVGISGVLDALQLMRHVFKIYTPTLNLSERYRFAANIEATMGAVKN
jgi:hypothetical protein